MSAQNFEIYLSFNTHSGGFLQAFFARTREKIMGIFEKRTAGEGADAALAQTAAAVHPDAARTADYFARLPYTSPEFINASLTGAAERGWITLEDGGFKATQKAIDLHEELVQWLRDELDPLANQVSVEIPALVAQLGQLVNGAAGVEIALKPTFDFGRNFEPKDKAPSLAWVRRHLLSLGSFRDDCHMSSWQQHDLPGYVWETLSFIWQENADTAEKLSEILSGYRGYQVEDYAAAIERLVAMGWVEPVADHYQVTTQGRAVREQSEELTNQYYAKAFAVLPEAQLQAVIQQLETMAAELAPVPEAEAQEA